MAVKIDGNGIDLLGGDITNGDNISSVSVDTTTTSSDSIEINANGGGKVILDVVNESSSSTYTVKVPNSGNVTLDTQTRVDGLMTSLNSRLDTHMSVPVSYHLLAGNLSVSASTITQGFNTTLYTGNGSTQNVTTGVDMDTQWGNTTEERFGGLVIVRPRTTISSWNFIDTVRGVGNVIYSDLTSTNTSVPTSITAFTNSGFSLGSAGINANASTMVSWNFQTTHRKTGVTNHGQAYTEHWNPYTGFTMIQYTGSGVAGHEIPNSLSNKLGFFLIKNLTNNADWRTVESSNNFFGVLNSNASLGYGLFFASNEKVTINVDTLPSNTSSNTYIMYGWANSYFDESNKLIGNYEVVQYQGTGVAGLKVPTRGKPAWVMIKRIDSTGNWIILDNKRNNISGLNDGELYPNLTNAEVAGFSIVTFLEDGFIVQDTSGDRNASGGQYIALVAYDTNANGGGSYYPLASDTANVQVNNAIIPIAQGIDVNGTKNTILSKNETITGLTYSQGKNYVYCDKNGAYGVTPYNPNYNTYTGFGDYYNSNTNKWYNNISIISNDFNDGTLQGWGASAVASISNVNNSLKIFMGTTDGAHAYKALTTVLGKKYRVFIKVNAGIDVDVHIGSAGNINDAGNTLVGNGTSRYIDFVASSNTTYIRLFLNTYTDNTSSFIDSIAVFPLNIDGMPDISTATEITNGRNYMNHIVYVDNDGGVEYVEELSKTKYEDSISIMNLESVGGKAITQSVTDTTDGKLLKVGDFGIGKINVITKVDLNTVLISGDYYANSGCLNQPNNFNGYLSVQYLQSGYCLQTYTIAGVNGANALCYVRQLYNSVWSAWTLVGSEQGTFTPVIYGTTVSGAGTYSSQTGVYRKIGKRVFIDILLIITAHTGSGNIVIDGLPYNTSTYSALTIAHVINLPYTGTLVAYVDTYDAAKIRLETIGNNVNVGSVAMDTNFTIIISGSYETNS